MRENDRVAVRGLTTLAAGSPITIELTHDDGSVDSFAAKHSLNDDQIKWFQAGSALNHIRATI